MATDLIIGIGNRDRGDDGVGPLIAEKLGKNTKLKKLGVNIAMHSGEGASLMELWQGANKVVIIDAMKSGIKVGEIRRFDTAKEKLPCGMFHYSTHVFSLAEGVELARSLGRLPNSLVVYGIEGKNFSFGAKLSLKVKKALAEVEQKIINEFTNFAKKADYA